MNNYSYWKGKIPRQGRMYLSVNYCCFHAYILGLETKVRLRWVDVVDVDKTTGMLFPDSIKLVTRGKEHYFSMFLRKTETFNLMVQLADIAAKR